MPSSTTTAAGSATERAAAAPLLLPLRLARALPPAGRAPRPPGRQKRAYALSGSSLLAFDPATLSSTTLPATAISGVAAGELLVGDRRAPAERHALRLLGVNATANTATLSTRSAPRPASPARSARPARSPWSSTGGNPVDLPDPATTGYGFDATPDRRPHPRTAGLGLNVRVNLNTGAAADGDAGRVGVNP